MILTLDTGAITGWASGNPGDEPRWGAEDFHAKTTGEVLYRLRSWLGGKCIEIEPDLIAFESPYVPRIGKRGPPPNAKTIRRLHAFAGCVEEVGWELGIKVYEVSILDIAQFFIGTRTLRREQKKAATVEMCRRYGWPTGCDNEADALAIWCMAEAQIAPLIAARRGAGPLFIPRNSARPSVEEPESCLQRGFV